MLPLSVQTAADSAPLTWTYLLAAIGVGLAALAPLLLCAYLDSRAHARRVARVRRLTWLDEARTAHRPEGPRA